MKEDPFLMLMVIIGVIAGTVILFLMLRDISLWYWRINEIHTQQNNIMRTLNKMLNHQITGSIYGDLKGEMIVENIKTGDMSAMTLDDWDNMTSGEQQKYEVLYYEPNDDAEDTNPTEL